jgi:hypothetical protein
MGGPGFDHWLLQRNAVETLARPDSESRPHALAAVTVGGAIVYRGDQGQESFDINSIRPEAMAAVEF